jgi:hypothetical protein
MAMDRIENPRLDLLFFEISRRFRVITPRIGNIKNLLFVEFKA